MSFIPNSNNMNSAYDASFADNPHEPAFAGSSFYKQVTYKDFLPKDTTRLNSKKQKTGFRFNNGFKSVTYKDFLPDNPSIQKKQSGFNNWFKSPTYKDFMPRYPAKKQNSIGTWIGSILGSTFGLGILTFFTRAHFFNGGLFKGGVKNTWNDVKKLVGIKLEQKTPSSSEESVGISPTQKTPAHLHTSHLFLEKQLERIRETVPISHQLTVEECKTLLFENSKNFVQKNSQLCYLLSGLGAMTHHPAFDKYLEQIRIIRQTNGFDVQFPGQNYRTFHVTDEDIIKNTGVESTSPGVHLWTLAYRQCDGAYNPNIQDDSVDALRRIFGDKDVIRIKSNRYVGHVLSWDPIKDWWIDDKSMENLRELQKLEDLSETDKEAKLVELQKQNKFKDLKEFEKQYVKDKPSIILNRLQIREHPSIDAEIEGQGFEWNKRSEVLQDYLHWLKSNPNHLALLTAHTGSYKSGHYYAVIPDKAKDDEHICLMNTFSMGQEEQVRIDQFFNQYDLWGHVDKSNYPGNSSTRPSNPTS